MQKLPVSPAVDTAAGALLGLAGAAAPDEPEWSDADEPAVGDVDVLDEPDKLAAGLTEPPEQALSIRHAPAAAAVIAAASEVDRSCDNVVPSLVDAAGRR